MGSNRAVILFFRYQSKGFSSLKSTRKGNKKCKGKLKSSGIAFMVFFDKYCLRNNTDNLFKCHEYRPYIFYFPFRFTIRTTRHEIPPRYSCYLIYSIVIKSSVFGVVKCDLFVKDNKAITFHHLKQAYPVMNLGRGVLA